MTALVEFFDVAQPLRAGLGVRDDHIRNITRSYAAAHRELNTLQQPAPAPLVFQPIGRYFGTVLVCRSATGALADDHLTDHASFCFQHGFAPTVKFSYPRVICIGGDERRVMMELSMSHLV